MGEGDGGEIGGGTGRGGEGGIGRVGGGKEEEEERGTHTQNRLSMNEVKIRIGTVWKLKQLQEVTY